MADISLMQNGSPDDSDEDAPGGVHFESALLKIQEYALSDSLARSLVPQALLNLFKNGPAHMIATNLPQVMDILTKLVNEDVSEVVVVTGVLEQVPKLAVTAKKRSAKVPEIKAIFSDYLLPLVLHNLMAKDSLVRKTAQSVLFTLLKHDIMNEEQMEMQVCPTILALTRTDSVEDYYTFAVTMMSKMTLHLGPDATEKFFLERFAQLCNDNLFYVRKLCASHFGYFCVAVGRRAYESILLPCYLTLCADYCWCVRKACADVVMCMSCACPPTKRRTLLAPAFVKFFHDENSWVRDSAFRYLGPFISTFAHPGIIQMTINNADEIAFVNKDGIEFSFSAHLKYTTLMGVSIDNNEYIVKLLTCMNNKKLNGDGDGESISDEKKWQNVELRLQQDMFGEDDELQKELDAEEEDDVGNSRESIAEHNDEVVAQNPFNVPVFKDSQWTRDDVDVATTDHVNLANVNKHNNLSDSEDIKEIVETVKNAVLSFQTECNNTNSPDTSIVDHLTHSNDCDKIDNKCSDGVCATIETTSSSQDCDHIYNNVKEESEIIRVALTNEEADATLKPYLTFNYWYVAPEDLTDTSLAALLDDELNLESPDEGRKPLTTRHMTPMYYFAVDANVKKVQNTDKNRNLGEMFAVFSSAEDSDSSDEDELLALQQDVPQFLIDHFISMTDPTLQTSGETELAYLCAYSLPAVALTLGKGNWHLLKPTVEMLAAHMKYEVRRTVASCLCELGDVLGREITTNDLLPIFEDFIKDLDEVRIEILRNLAYFLELILPKKRSIFLPRLADFLRIDNEIDWRFRQELAKQLTLILPLFRPTDISKYISTLAQELLCDKVAAVREVALDLVAELLKHTSTDRALTTRLLAIYTERFAHSKKWKLRQSFALLCAEIVTIQAIDLEKFASEIMPHLIDLSWDPVPNVRLVVARTISRHLINNEYFANEHGLQSVLWRLKGDKDRDVRQCAVQNKNTY